MAPKLFSVLQFYQIGNIDLSYDFKKCCIEKNIMANITLTGQLDHKNCLGYLKSSDVLLIIQPSTKTQIPSKLYEYIYLDKPILSITEKHSSLSKLLHDYKFGQTFEPNEHSKIANYLFDLVKNKKTGKQRTSNYKNKKIV